MKNVDCKNRKTVENTQQTSQETNQDAEQQRLKIGHAYINTLRGVPKNINNRKPKIQKRIKYTKLRHHHQLKNSSYANKYKKETRKVTNQSPASSDLHRLLNNNATNKDTPNILKISSSSSLPQRKRSH